MKQDPESKVAAFLEEYAFPVGERHLLAAVSGGSDSVSLLCLLHRLSPILRFRLSAVTVSHLIRSPAESGGDARFVAALCAGLEPPVPCTVAELAPGEVARTAAERGRGIEDAARHLRYLQFERAADEARADFILTGHTLNDQLETVLMRFLQGSGGSAAAGIAPRRGRYLRPLLGCERGELEAWLKGAGFSWRTDATNADTAYLRNRIRLALVPCLDRVVPGWESGVLASAEKAHDDDDLVRSLPCPSWVRTGDGIECESALFAALHPALRRRFLLDGLNLLGVGSRVSWGYLKRIVREVEPEGNPDAGTNRVIAGSGLVFRREGKRLFWGTDIVQNTKSGYLVYIASCGRYRLPCGTILVSGEPGAVYLDDYLGPFSLPLVIRSRNPGDTVRMAGGRQKTLKKLMNDWSVPEAVRSSVPVVEEAGIVRAVYGTPFGLPDWFVQN
jgi:tRNA(Ile)-lysidine synthetase, N-terminal domain/tRNA(Ile)-lysidine synthetase, C-terminal domain